MKKVLGGILSALALLPYSTQAAERWQMNLTPGVTEISREVYNLHMFALWICVAIGVVVFGAMFYSIMHHRKDKGYKAATFHESIKVEIVWTLIPVGILIALAIPAAQALIKMDDSSNSDLTIKVTAYQWRWQYEYPEQSISFFSNLDSKSREAAERNSGIDPRTVDNYILEVDNPMVIPVGKKVRLLITSNDVIHSWGMPAFAVKKDAIPGFVNDAWFKADKPGEYYGQCVELCGKDHGYMPIKVVALEQAGFDAWMAEQKEAAAARLKAESEVWTRESLVERGANLYASLCIACHQANGQGIPGVFPAITGSPYVTGDIKAHLGVVMNGVPGTAMQAFGPQLSDADLAALITYQRNALGNSTGDELQPADVRAMR